MTQAVKRRWGIAVAAAALIAYVVAFAVFFDDADVSLGWEAWGILVAASVIQMLALWLFGELFRQGVAVTGHTISSGLGFRAALVGSSVARLLPAGGAVTPVAMAWTVRGQAPGSGGAAVRATALNYGGLILLTSLGLFVYSLSGANPAMSGTLNVVAGVALAIGLAIVALASRLGALREKMPEWVKRRLGEAMVDLPVDLRAHGYVWGRLAGEAVVLGLVLIAFRIDLGVVEVATAFGITQLAAGIPGTPGGLGFAEAGLVGALAFFGIGAGASVAPVLVFRVISYWLPAGAGLVAGTSAFLSTARNDNGETPAQA
ncbi:MAG: YbhN family protein [Actinomycetota bacterium]